MPLLEERYGTSIYSAWILESLGQLAGLQSCCAYLIIDPLFMDFASQKQTIACYRGVLEGKLSVREAQTLLPPIVDHPYHSGFHYRKTTKGKVIGDV
jgi:hypothetical protein